MRETDRLAIEVGASLNIGNPEGTPAVAPVLTVRCGHRKKSGKHCQEVVLRVYPTSGGHLAAGFFPPWDGTRHKGHTGWSLGWVDGPHHQLGDDVDAGCKDGHGQWVVDLARLAEYLGQPRKRSAPDPFIKEGKEGFASLAPYSGKPRKRSAPDPT